MTAVNGGPIHLAEDVVPRRMFGNTSRIVGIERTLSERFGDRALADYVRWEFRPADREGAVLALRGAALRPMRQTRIAPSGTLLRRLRTWMKTMRTPKQVPAEATSQDLNAV